METDLAQRVVMITGASGGIGSATARAFAGEGARLVLHAHSRLDAAVSLAGDLSTESLAIGADLRSEDEVANLFARAEERFGVIDVLVANAGIWPEAEADIGSMSLARWEQVVATNQTSVFLCARGFFDHLRRHAATDPALILVGSTAAVFGEAGHAAYAASKAAITFGLTRSLKNEIVHLAPRGRVNAVCPGWTRTPMAAAGLADAAAVERVLDTRPLRSIAEPADIARAIVFLASSRLAGHITGQILTVAGGMEGRRLDRDEPTAAPTGPTH
ncbi:MAG: SDR family NAD(P)-dependent oxidoreductase [Acidobacteriota bacterium]